MYQLYSPADDGWGNLGCGKGKKKKGNWSSPQKLYDQKDKWQNQLKQQWQDKTELGNTVYKKSVELQSYKIEYILDKIRKSREAEFSRSGVGKQ